MQKRLCALALAALMLCSCGGEKKGAEKTKKEKPASELTLAQQFSDKLDGGKYDITMNVTGKNYADGMKCRMWGRDGDGGETEEIKIFVTYTVDGQEYTEELNNTKTNLKEGENITVLYNPEDPTEVSGASKGGVALQIGFGSLFLLGGLASLAALIIKGR